MSGVGAARPTLVGSPGKQLRAGPNPHVRPPCSPPAPLALAPSRACHCSGCPRAPSPQCPRLGSRASLHPPLLWSPTAGNWGLLPSAQAHELALEGGEEREKEKEKENREREWESCPLSLETSREEGGLGSHRRDPTPAGAAEEEAGTAALLGRRSVPEDEEALEAVRGRGRGGGGGAGGWGDRAAYQAVSCGDKQSPEVIGVHAACLLLLRGRRHSRGGRAQSRQEGPPHVHSGQTGQWRGAGRQRPQETR